jgi:hypothetical protein
VPVDPVLIVSSDPLPLELAESCTEAAEIALPDESRTVPLICPDEFPRKIFALAGNPGPT